MFSSRLPAAIAANRLTQAVADLRRSGRALLDLTQSNPTRAGFDYAPDLLAPLASPPALRYDPAPLGALDARRAVSADYARRGVDAPPDRIVLTASSSESYAELFKLLADPGDEILVPRPSYPLFEHLGRLDAVVVRTYDLEYYGRWSIDLEGLARAVTPRTRAILIVSPNNPTGSFVKADELDRIAACAASQGAAVIADEVFADYVLDPDAAAASGRVLARTDVLSFTLGGLSKSVGLPQVKLGWIVAGGPPGLVRGALERLEFINDAYLSASTPAQIAAPILLERGASIRSAIQARLAANHRRLVAQTTEVPSCRALHVEGGWYAILQTPAIRAEDEMVLDLVTADGVLVHPGYFFDFPAEAYLVLSLLTPEGEFGEGLRRLLRRVGA
jgi:alanine-synthesizing transaminase